MRNRETYALGILGDPDKLAERVLVSGIRLLDPDEAASLGYGVREVIIPTEPRLPSKAELEAIRATSETRRVAKFVKVAQEVGQRAVEVARVPGWSFNPDSELTAFGHGVVGISGGFRKDPANRTTVSVDDQDLAVGLHIDNQPRHPNLRAAILNMGQEGEEEAGTRWHIVTPGFNTDSLDGQPPRPAVRNAYMRQLVRTGADEEVMSYWFKLDPPELDVSTGHVMVEALTGSPITWGLHDGSTYGDPRPSTAAFIASRDPNAWEQYPSLV